MDFPSFRGLSLLLCLLFGSSCTAAKALYNTTGFDLIEYVESSTIADFCMSDSFDFNGGNVEDSEVVERYGVWIAAKYPEFLENNEPDEVHFIGDELLGVPNFKCDYVDGSCTDLPTCEEIGISMGINPSQNLNQSQADDLRRRYFLANMLESTIHFYHERDAALQLAKDDIDHMIPDLVAIFATQPDQVAMAKCQFQKQIKIAAMITVVTAAGIGTAWLPGIPATLFSAGAAGLGGVLSSVSAKIGSVITRVGSKVGFKGASVGSGALKNGMKNGMNGVKNGMNGVKDVMKNGKNVGNNVVKGEKGTGDTKTKYFLTDGQLSALINNGVGIGVGLGINLGLWNPSLPMDRQPTELLRTLLDTGSCAGSMGEFPDQNLLIQNDLTGYVGRLFNDSIEALAESVDESFHNNSLLPNGRSHVWAEFNSTTWALPMILGDELRHVFHRTITHQVKVDTIAQLLRGSQCYIKCLRLEPLASVSDRFGFKLDGEKENGTLLDLATFYPERVLAGANSSITPTMQCQFQCLKQNNKGQIFFPDTLLDLEKQTNMHPHTLFTQAVVNHLAGTGAADYKAVFSNSYPTFRLPVCITERTEIRSTASEFPFQCGDWTADETIQFFQEMPIGPGSTNFESRKLEPFYQKGLGKSLSLNEHRPLTHFLTLCNVDYKFRHYDWRTHTESDWVGGSESICPTIREDVKNMTELEANLWFCYGTTTAKTLKDEGWQATQYDHHKEFCDKLAHCPGPGTINHWAAWCQNADNPQFMHPFGFSRNTYIEFVDDYTSQLEVWKKDGAVNPPFRWLPTDPVALKPPPIWIRMRPEFVDESGCYSVKEGLCD